MLVEKVREDISRSIIEHGKRIGTLEMMIDGKDKPLNSVLYR